ncbi:MAG TPA: citramalate synthase [Dehalococcoidia bacterium]|nr:citramalate synthase [Dehalococcoidia bacterium]
MTVELYDTTLRDGAQMEGMSLSVEDKLKVARKLDELGVHFIEGGWPGSNPKDAEFFARARSINFQHARLAAFGSTRRAGGDAPSDPNLRALVDARTPVVTLVGKTNDLHVRKVLETTLEENLAMIADSVRYMAANGRTVFFDAEHFFDGFLSDPAYALRCLQAAATAGASRLVLCDTNGGMTTDQLVAAIRAVQAETDVPLGIHTHNDADLAVANSLAAVREGVRQVQACVNGYGERCGNANLISIIANLKLKMGVDVVSGEQLAMLTEVSHYVSEVVNMVPNPYQPYVGTSAFTHKGGLHVAAVLKTDASYQHVSPALVGNERRLVVSELGGSRGVQQKLKEVGFEHELSRDEARTLQELVNEQEAKGYQYEGAEASFEMLVRRARPGYAPPFELEDFWIVERRASAAAGHDREMQAEAMVKLRIDGKLMQTAAEGNGPVNALDAAVRKAMVEFFPTIYAVKLIDFKVRIIDSAAGTSAAVRVLIESSDGERMWTTVGASTDIIEAAWLALADSLEYFLVRRAGWTPG